MSSHADRVKPSAARSIATAIAQLLGADPNADVRIRLLNGADTHVGKLAEVNDGDQALLLTTSSAEVIVLPVAAVETIRLANTTSPARSHSVTELRLPDSEALR